MISAVVCLLFILGAPQLVSAAPAEADLFAEAESRYLGRNYTAALEAYDEYLGAYPLSERISDVQYRRAVCFYRLARYRDAVQLIGDIEIRYRSTRYFPYVPLWKGLSLYSLGSYSLSVDSLDIFLKEQKDPDLTPQALLHKSLALSAMSSDAAAVDTLRLLTAGYPESRLIPYASVLLGSLLQKQGAQADLLALTQSTNAGGFPEPWRSSFLLLRAESLWQAGRQDDAQPLYLQLVGASDEIALVAYGRLFAAAQRKGDLQSMRDLTQAASDRFKGRTKLLSDLWTRVGAETFRQGSSDAAEPFLRRAWDARKDAPVNEIVPLYLAEIKLTRKDPAAARQILLDFLSGGTPGTGAVIIRLGDIALMGEDFPSAETSYRQFRATFPDSKRWAEAGYLLAYCLFREGKQQESEREVTELLRQDLDPSLRQQVARLQIVLLNGAKRTAEAAAALSDYVARYPADLRSRVDYLKTLFVLGQNDTIVREADAVRRQFPDIDSRDPYASIVLSYLRGLSLISRKEFGGAMSDLASIKPDAAQKAGLGVIVPYARYYLGWAYLRTGDFASAAQVFEDLAAGSPQHELRPMAVYLSGWARFSKGDFDKAATAFSAAAATPGRTDLGAKSRYLYAKSLINMKQRDQAAQVLAGIAGEKPPGAWAADALFDYAGLLSDMDQARQAADAYKRLADTFVDSPLREEAVYRRAETFFTHGMWPEARAAFDEYRTRFARGKLVDAALYWSGQAAQSMGEGMAAALLWEQLLAGWKDSPFRASALQQTAEAYAQVRQYQKALDLFTRFAADYPDEARAARTDIRAEQLRLLAGGQGDRESELSAIIARESGDRKRQATLDLARLYVYSGDKRADTGPALLQPMIAEGTPQFAPQAQILLGEYYYRKGNLTEAARQLIAAAVIPKADPSVAASALYRAAEMMQLAKKPDEVAAIVKRLEAGFPGSEWTVKARLLVGGAK
jgi:TolA-binding protein